MMERITPGSYEQILQQEGTIVVTVEGTSMLPFLRPRRDTVLLQAFPPKGDGTVGTDVYPLNPLDVVLYHREDGTYVLHRVLKNEGDTLRIRGDNCTKVEAVPAALVIAVMRGFWREDRYIPATHGKAGKEDALEMPGTGGLGYRLLVRIWVSLNGLLRLYKWIRKAAGRLKQKMIR